MDESIVHASPFGQNVALEVAPRDCFWFLSDPCTVYYSVETGIFKFSFLYYCKEKYTYQWNKLVFPRSAAIVSAVSTSSCFTFTRNLIDLPAFFLFGRNWVRGRWYGSVSPIRRHQIARINTPDGGAPKRSSSHSDHSQSHLAGKTIFLGSYAGLVMIF